MTDAEKDDEAREEAIEDLEAPAETLGDVAGGGCQEHTAIQCIVPTCAATKIDCRTASGGGVVWNH